MRRRCRRRNCWSRSNCRSRERTPRISSTNSPGGTATTPSPVSRRRRSWKAMPSPIFGWPSLPSAIGRYWPRPRAKLVNVAVTPAVLSDASAALGEELDPAGRSAGVRFDAPASGKGAAGALRVRAARPPRSRCRGTGVTAPMPISLDVNGERVDAHVLPRLNLADFLREHLQLTGTHVGCEHGVCGACTVRVNGEIVRSCLMLAVQTHGASVETIEGLSDSGEIADLQAAFRDRNALQCGYLHAGHADGGAGSAEAAGRAGPRADPRASFRQLLPLHRLPGHHRRGRDHGAGARERTP